MDKFDAFESEKKSYPTQPHKPNAVIGQQILTLKLITTKVNYAYNGLEVEWQDNGNGTIGYFTGDVLSTNLISLVNLIYHVLTSSFISCTLSFWL